MLIKILKTVTLVMEAELGSNFNDLEQISDMNGCNGIRISDIELYYFISFFKILNQLC